MNNESLFEEIIKTIMTFDQIRPRTTYTSLVLLVFYFSRMMRRKKRQNWRFKKK